MELRSSESEQNAGELYSDSHGDSCKSGLLDQIWGATVQQGGWRMQDAHSVQKAASLVMSPGVHGPDSNDFSSVSNDVKP